MSNQKLTVQPRTVLLLVLAAAGLLAFAALRPASGVARGGCPGAGGGPDQTSTAQMRQATICLINQIRRQHGLGSVHSDNSPGGSSIESRIGGSGYLRGAHSYMYGEIIGGGTSHGGSAKSVAIAWMHSPPHRAAILTGRFSDLGVGVAHGFPGRGSHGATFTVDFGSRH
jgi:uncharacterized protein YkwD